jgi:hypothetical protein
LSTVIGCGICGSSAASSGLRGPNCSLSVPPEDAGEDGSHYLLMVYPRAKDLGAKYSGCQSRWMWAGTDWHLLEISYFWRGELRTHHLPSYQGSPAVTCRYSKGVLLSGERRSCPRAKELPRKSLSAGCKTNPAIFHELRCNTYE